LQSLIRIRLHLDPDPVKIRIQPDPKYGIRCTLHCGYVVAMVFIKLINTVPTLLVV